MDLDLARLPTGTAGWHALVNYALALGDLSEVGHLELKGALPFSDRTTRKRSAVVIGRAVLGMANRMPDAADAHFGGHGVVLVGVQNQQVVGVERVDGAELAAALQPYVGEDGPRWDYQFVDHGDGLVLAVVVDPPQWGDRIHACRKDYSDNATKLAVRDGEVFVRIPGATRPATSTDIANLERRRDQAPNRGAAITLEYTGKFDHVDVDSVMQMVTDAIELHAQTLLSDVTPEPPRSDLFRNSALESLRSPIGDRRSRQAFRAEVQSWKAEAAAVAAQVADDFCRRTLDLGTLHLMNQSTKYLEDVQAQVHFPPGVAVLAESDSEYYAEQKDDPFHFLEALPRGPVRWGMDRGLGYFGNIASPIVPGASRWRPDARVAVDSGAYTITWDVGDLRPGNTNASEERFVIFSGLSGVDVAARWTVTARGVDHVFEGTARIECRQESGQVLAWQYGSADDSDS